jgi:hypothetical protein
MVTARTPSPIDAVLPEYIALHESTGESYESIADRVEEQGGRPRWSSDCASSTTTRRPTR